MPRLLRIIALDDCASDVRRLRSCLGDRTDRRVSVQHVASEERAIARLPRMRADALFIDEGLARVTGVEAIAALRSIGEMRPIVATTAVDCGYLAADLIRAGADGYLAKHDLTPAMVERVLARAMQCARGRWASDQLRRRAVAAMLAGRGHLVVGPA